MAVLVAAAPFGAAAADAAEPGGRLEVNAMEYPWSAIGRLNAGGRGHCTGFLIGERQVLTAAHCLYDPREARWRHPAEMHFLAGYQRDSYPIHAAVLSYERSKAFDAAAGPRPENAVADWAVLTLAAPIGRQAGWLGLRRLDKPLLDRLARGEAHLLQAGYRRGFSHIISASLHCRLAGFFESGKGIVHSCAVAHGDSGSPLLVAAEGKFQVAGLHVLTAEIRAHPSAGALSAAIFHPEGGSAEAAAALRRAGVGWSPGRAPVSGSPAAPVPLRTIELVLHRLGHLPAASPTTDGNRRRAIAAFQSQAGLAVTGEPSLALLERLIEAWRPAPSAPQDRADLPH